MVIKTEFRKQEIPYRGEFEYSFTMFINGKFYKEVGGLPSLRDCLKLYSEIRQKK